MVNILADADGDHGDDDDDQGLAQEKISGWGMCPHGGGLGLVPPDVVKFYSELDWKAPSLYFYEKTTS